MLDYKNGKIYQIVCNITGERYVGSTCKSLEDRLKTHIDFLDCSSKQIIKRRNYYIELLENYPCESDNELKRKEGEYQKTMECINIYIAGRTRKEWYQDNKEEIRIKKNQYYQDNKEYFRNVDKMYSIKYAEKRKIREGKIVICECGSKSTHHHLARHKRSKKHIDLMNKLTLPSNYLLGEEMAV